jgi:hypothetical protein
MVKTDTQAKRRKQGEVKVTRKKTVVMGRKLPLEQV